MTVFKVFLLQFSTNFLIFLLSHFIYFYQNTPWYCSCFESCFQPLLSLCSLWNTGQHWHLIRSSYNQLLYSLCFLSLLESVLPLFVSSVIYVSSYCIFHFAAKLPFCLRVLPMLFALPVEILHLSDSSLSFYLLRQTVTIKNPSGKVGSKLMIDLIPNGYW